MREFCTSSICLLLLISIGSSCIKSPTCNNDRITESRTLFECLQQVISDGQSINYLERNDEEIRISLSNNQSFCYSSSKSLLLTIGLDGLWYLNGLPTLFSLEEYSSDAIVKCFFKDDGEMVLIIEGYDDWYFFFLDSPVVSISKSSFSDDLDKFIISICHRGYNSIAPENTLPAYRLARLKGFRYVETDVRFTSDGIPVLLHDASIDRTSDGSGRIDEMTFSQVREYDFGGWKSPTYKKTLIPSLDEFLLLCRSIGLRPIIEIKAGSSKQISQIINLVDSMGLEDDVYYISFSDKVLHSVLEFKSNASASLLTSSINDGIINLARRLQTGTSKICINSSDFSQEAVNKCKEANLPLWVWSLNNEDTILNLDSYISAVTSDSIHAGRLLYGANK